MKYLLSTLLFALLLVSCGSDGADSANDGSNQTNTSIPAVTPATTPLPNDPNAVPPAAPANQPPAVNIPAGPDGVVHHYVCPNNDGGNGTGGGPCPVCGTAMAHNTAFHANQQNPTVPPVTINNADGTSTPGTVTTTPPGAIGSPGATPPVEPPQNSKGVWHYTCTNGCAGGAGGASACAGCGSTLVHNPIYHQ